MSYFHGKTAVVTGGASGIGRALCQALLAQGAQVVIADIEQSALDRACAELGGGAALAGCRTDVTAPDSVAALADFTWQRFGACELLFNNAGVGLKEAQRRLWTLPPADWSWGFQVNLFGAINGIRAFVPRMLDSGRRCHVINTSSSNGGLAPLPTTPIYAASKAAITSVTEVLNYQLQMEQADISAHILFPGPHLVNTNILNSERNRPGGGAAGGYTSMRELAEKSGIAFEITEPEDVARYCLAGIEQGRFWIVPDTAPADARFERRVRHIRELTRPQVSEFQTP
jgi:NAD(P)-dependent dehydrogenase (short-subunit alcohol dehydrogenase family)